MCVMQLELRKNLKAFTLAEVLITLTVIGVVAVLAIPALLNNLRDYQNKSSWKSAFSDFSQAIGRLSYDQCSNFAGLFTTADVFRDKIIANMNYIKKCDAGTGLGSNGCWHASNTWYQLSRTPITYGDVFPNYSRVVLNNGMLIVFRLDDTNCANIESPKMDSCGIIIVDVNGFKGPNIVGKDIYALRVLKNAIIVPSGTQGDINYNAPNVNSCDPVTYPNTEGWNCSAQYLMQ